MRLAFAFCFFLFFSFLSLFFFFFHAFKLLETSFTVHHCSHTVHGTYNHFIKKKNIKNGTHGTIHTFKNYFATVFSVFSFSKNKLYSNGPKWNELFFKQNTKHENTYKTKQNIVISVGSVTNSVWSCNSNGSIAPASERDSPSNRRPRLDRLVTEAVWFDWHRSVGLTSVSLCSPLPHFNQLLFFIFYTTKKIAINDGQSLSQQHKKPSQISIVDGKRPSTAVGKSLAGNTILPTRPLLTLIFDSITPS